MPAKKTSAKKNAARPGRLRIRMFRQGLGDCFLLTFDGKVHVLIDCGVIVGTEDPETAMGKVVESISAATNGVVDVLVVTHEHWDHVSGFKQALKRFDEIDFKEVWMAWTEDDGNDLADRLRAERAKKKKAAKAAAEHLKKSSDKRLKSLGNGVAEILAFSGLSLDDAARYEGDTGEAMKYARDRGRKPNAELRFLRPGGDTFPLPGTKDVRIFVLGPPEDEKLLKRSDPSKANSEVYLSLSDSLLAAADVDGADPEVADAAAPFIARCRIAAQDGGVTGDQASTELKELVQGCYLAPDEEYRRIEEDWLATASTLALKLDSDTNNTSLVLAFEFTDTGDVFLFPGDAQVGNWLSWDKYTWSLKDKNGQKAVVTAADLLARTLFYKVGHHGSHNATLQEKGLERMVRPDLVAMVPVDQKMAAKKKWKMPWRKLRERLEAKCSALIIQDEPEAAAKLKPKRGKVVVDSAKTPLYIDYIV